MAIGLAHDYVERLGMSTDFGRMTWLEEFYWQVMSNTKSECLLHAERISRPHVRLPGAGRASKVGFHGSIIPLWGSLSIFNSRSWARILRRMSSTHTASHSALVIRGVIKKCLRLVLPTRPSPTVELRDYREPSAFNLVADYVNAEVDLRGRQTEPRPLAQSFTEQFLLQSGAHDPESCKPSQLR